MTRFALPLLLALVATPAFAQEDISRVNGAVTADAGGHYGDLDTVNGGIRIGDGARFANAETVNGGIRAGDNIQGQDIETVNGGITVGHGASVRRMTTVNGGIRAGRDLRTTGRVEAVSGSVFIDRGGHVDGHVKTVNGGIGLVATEVTGHVETTTGDVTIGVDSHVHGGLTVRKPTSNWFIVNVNRRVPRVVIGPGAVVDGPLVFEHEVSLYVHDTARTGAITGATAVPFSGRRAPRD